VSGGADSLALALLSAEYFQHCNTYTIDHKLRSESSREAEYVQTILKDRGQHYYFFKMIKLNCKNKFVFFFKKKQ